MEQAVEMRDRAGRKGQVELEASGGVTLETVRSIAPTGVERIAVGAITHSAPALDIGLDIEDVARCQSTVRARSPPAQSRRAHPIRFDRLRRSQSVGPGFAAADLVANRTIVRIQCVRPVRGIRAGG